MCPSFRFAGSRIRGFAGINKSLCLRRVGAVAFIQTFPDSTYQLFGSTLGGKGTVL